MGLKKAGPEDVAEAAPVVAPVPPPKVAKTEGESVLLLAVYNSIGDPITGIKYQVVGPMPAVVKEGNWVDAQIKAGILKVCAPAPVDPADAEKK